MTGGDGGVSVPDTRAEALPSPAPRQRGTVSLFGGVVRVLAATGFWSSSAVLIDRISTTYHLTILQISTWRVLLAAPLAGLLGLTSSRESFRVSRSDLAYFFVAGLVGVMAAYA